MQIWWRRRRVARLFCVCEGGWGVRLGSENANSSRGDRGHAPREILENLECLGLHFTRFDGGQRKK